jgi:hypothetical protein
MDAVYGISEARNKLMELNTDNTFRFTYSYYYERENTYYQLTTQTDQKIELSGKINAQSPSMWICQITLGEYQNNSL